VGKNTNVVVIRSLDESMIGFVFGWFRELFFGVFAIISWFLGYFWPMDKILRSGESGEIVFVHGWFSQNPLFFFLKRYLVKKGFRVYMTNFGAHLGDLRELADRLSEFIKKNDLDNVVLVGFSNGAIISLLYLQEMDGWQKVRQFIGIGGPYKGAPLARFGFFSKSARQLLPKSEFLEKLFKNDLVNPDKITCISAKHDEIVPTWSSQLPGVKNEVLPIIGHVYLGAFSQSTYDLVVKYAKLK